MNDKKEKDETIKDIVIVENADLLKHSALTTYRTSDKRLPLSVSKAIQAIYAKEQKILKEHFRENVLKIIEKIYPKSEIEKIMEKIYSKKLVNFQDLNINYEKLQDFVSEVLSDRIHNTKWNIMDKKTKQFKFNELKDNLLTKLALQYNEPMSNLAIEYLMIEKESLGIEDKQFNLKEQEDKKIELKTNEQLNELLFEIKNYCREKAIKASSGTQHLDYSMLAKSLGVNNARFRKDLKKASSTSFEFNYINKKNLDITINTAMLASTTFVKGNNETFLEYQIPIEILRFLLLPAMFIDMKEEITFKITNDYAYDLYQFLSDHILKGEVTITKEELFEFLNLNKKARESKYELQRRVLIPAVADLEAVTDINVSYEFIPENRWKKIRFFVKEKEKFVIKKEPIIRKVQEVKKDYKDNPRILRALEKAKRNIYVSRAMKKFVYTKINKIYNELGEDFTVLILNNLYTSLNDNIQTSLVQYINGMIKNIKDEAKEDKKRLSKKMLEQCLKKKIEQIDESIIPTFKDKEQVETFLINLSQCLFKTQITFDEAMKFRTELTRFGREKRFIDLVLEKYYEIV